MLEESAFDEGVSSFPWPVPLVVIDPDVDPLISVSFNSFWLPYILGSLTQLVQQTTWDTADPGDLTLVQARAMSLLSQFSQAIDMTTPPGMIAPYAGTTAPSQWLLCNGAAVSRATYAALFAVIGTLYGAGNGTTTFNLPDLTGRFPFGQIAGSPTPAFTLAHTFGVDQVVLTTPEIPAHLHTSNAHHHSYTKPIPTSLYAVAAADGGTLTVSESGDGAGAVGNSSGNNSELAMSFIPFAGQLTQIRVGHNVNVGSPSGTVAWRICANGSGAPGAILASGTYTPVASSQNIINVPVGLFLKPSTTYWLWLRPSTPQSTNVRWTVNHNSTTYANGTYKQTVNAGSNWSTISGFWMDIVIATAATGPASDYPILTTESNTTTDTTDTMNDTGGDGAHENMPPALSLNYIIKT
jgi:microcystin-dependent protein